MNSAACGDNSVDNECNAALAVYAVGTPATGMQSNAVYGGAKTRSAYDGVAGVFVSDASGAATGVGIGAYIEGRRDAAGARGWLAPKSGPTISLAPPAHVSPAGFRRPARYG
jgi:hypothetical protein